jgi:nitrile hydratase accessory protein
LKLPETGEEPVFAAPWEAQAFAMAVKLNERGVFSWSEWAAALGQEVAKGGSYYESLLAALERLVEEKGLLTRSERHNRIDAWDRAAHATPHGQPIELSRAFADPEMSPAANRTSPGSTR